jgi:hypothetical protein
MEKITTSSKRCSRCKRKLNIFENFTCECGKQLCISHLTSFEHDCLIDKKERYKKKLKEQMPRIVKEKFEKI